MKQCPKCNSSIIDTAKFCPKCGVNIKQYEDENPKDTFCSECGAKLGEGDFCPECGARVDHAVASVESIDMFDDDWLSSIDEVTTADVEREKARKQAEEKAQREAEEKERQRKAAEEAARQEAARQEAARQAELKKRREALFAQRFQRDENTIYFGNWPQSRAKDVSSYGADGYCTINGKQYYRKTVSWKMKKLVGWTDKISTSCFEIEPIKWKILEETDEAALVVCADIIDYRQFRNSTIGNTADYINSDLRKWLNGEFFNKAFSSEEQSYIRPTEINYNMDKVFIPSEEDCREHYINPDYSSYVSKCHADGGYHSGGVSDLFPHIYWWVRNSSAATGTSVNIRYMDSHISSEANHKEGVVPMLYIDKTKLC